MFIENTRFDLMLPRPGVIGSFLSAEVGMRGSPMEPAHQAKL
jgi:hypothetical protein